MYCGKEADIFIKSLLDEFINDFPDMPLYLRGDSGFASPDLYEVLEDKNCTYAIHLKENAKLRELVEDENQDLYRATKHNQLDYAVVYGEFLYQTRSWSHPRRVVFKIEKPYGQMIHMYIFVVTIFEMEPYKVIQFYCGRGQHGELHQKSEKGIKETPRIRKNVVFMRLPGILKSLNRPKISLYGRKKSYYFLFSKSKSSYIQPTNLQPHNLQMRLSQFHDFHVSG